jgi:hypothetical protein
MTRHNSNSEDLRDWPQIACDAWGAPFWRGSAAQYHTARDRRRSVVELEPERLRRLRALLDDSVSLERAYIEAGRSRSAPQTVVDALMLSLRLGVDELAEPDALRQLSELDEDQLGEVCDRAQNFKSNIAPAWTPEEVKALVIIWRKSHE